MKTVSMKTVCIVGIFSFLAWLPLLAGCPSPADGGGAPEPEAPPHVAVTGIVNVPKTGVKGASIDLSLAAVVPGNASYKAITWAVKEPGRAALRRGLTGDQFIPDSAGTAVITGRVANGKAPGEDFTQDFELAIADNFKAVTDIRWDAPANAPMGSPIDLSAAEVLPQDATDRTILWAVADDSGVQAERTGEASFTPAGPGQLKLAATVAQGLSGGSQAFTKTFDITIDPPAPDAPGAPALVPGNTRITASWDAVPYAAAYEVWYGTANDSGLARQVAGDQSSPAAITGLDNGTTYHVWIRAKNAAGTSGFSPGAAATPLLPYTGDIAFTLSGFTANDAAAGERAGAGTGTQTQALTARDTYQTAYFGVTKTAAQTIAIGGTHGSLATQYTSGAPVNGVAPSDTLSVFSVDLSAFDLMFEGGSRSFTLTVSETGKSPVTVTVNLNTATDLTGVAVFKVARSADQEIVAAANGIPAQAEQWARAGSLERIPDLKKWDLAGNTFTGTDADSLLDAIAWVDQNAATGEEYLIRVEQDEEAPNIKITFAGQDKVTLRLRGYGAERTIKHNGSINALYWNPAVSMAISYDVFFSLGGMDSGGYIIADSIHSLHLENNITFDGKGADRMDNHFRGLISMGRNSRLILLEGSKITNYNGTSGQSESFVPVYIQGGMSAPGSEEMLVSFYMYGGAITGNDLAGPSTVVGIDSVGYTPVFFNTRANTTGSSSLATRINQPVFFIFGGSYSGNFRHPLSGGEPESGDKVRFGLSSSYSTMYDIEPGHAYALPEFN